MNTFTVGQAVLFTYAPWGLKDVPGIVYEVNPVLPISPYAVTYEKAGHLVNVACAPDELVPYDGHITGDLSEALMGVRAAILDLESEETR